MFRWLAAVTLEWSLVLLCFCTIVRWPACAPIGVFVIGTRQHAIGILGHEAAHRKGLLNDLLACLLCWWPLGICLTAYRRFHFMHHQLLGSPHDPEEIHRNELSPWQWKNVTPVKKLLLFAMDHLGLGLWEVATALRIIGPPVGIGWMAPVISGVAALLFFWLWPWGLLWHLSLVTSFWAVGRMRMYTEHYGSGDELTHRTVAPSLWRQAIYLPWGTWKHAEHHQRPGLRQYELEATCL